MEADQTAQAGASSQQTQMENIRVAVRLRPFTEKEKSRNQKRIVEIEQNTVALYCRKSQNDPNGPKIFTFDRSYWSHDGFIRDSKGNNVPDPSHPNGAKYVSQEKVFEDLGRFLLNNSLEGYNSALLAYGQTGSGKSYTISGYGQNEGILPRFARELYNELDRKYDTSVANVGELGRYEVHFSMLEIYNEVVRDLLGKGHTDTGTRSRRGLKVREHPKQGFFVENLTSYVCHNRDEIERKICEGQWNKSIAATSMNETSSRGHTIYEFKIKQFKLGKNQKSEEMLTSSVVQLVDLAGSERMAVHLTGQPKEITARVNSKRSSATPTNMTQRARAELPPVHDVPRSAAISSDHLNSSTQQRFKESVSINQSLSALGNCIQVLSQYSQQLDTSTPGSSSSRRSGPKIPYRDSILTKLLNRCCLSGTSRVVIIATLSPVESSYDDTLSTLRFADRAKQITTHAVVNLMDRHHLMHSLHKENERLKQIIDGRTTRSDDSSQTSNFDDTENILENFRGSRIGATATPIRGRTGTRKIRQPELEIDKSSPQQRLSRASTKVSHSSNPSLVAKDQMKRLVSPASMKTREQPMSKSRSMAHGLSSVHRETFSRVSKDNSILNDEDLDEIDLNDLDDLCDEDDDDEDDVEREVETGAGQESEGDSYSALADSEISTEEKISLFNKMLSNSTIPSKIRRSKLDEGQLRKSSKIVRPRKADASQAGIKQLYILSSSLKRSNPYLSNLNPDEQLTGMISFIIKRGETIIGKDNTCDIVLHGPEIRGRHAKILREQKPSRTSNIDDKESSDNYSLVYIEPILAEQEGDNNSESQLSLKVNGVTVTQRTQLNHCDRLLFGTNSYYVLNNSPASSSGENRTLADPDLVTFDMARNEVLKKVMAETNNEAMIKEINDYTHRPGTGKHRTKGESVPHSGIAQGRGSRQNSALIRNTTIENSADSPVDDTTEIEARKDEARARSDDGNASTAQGGADLDSSDALYRDQLMHDTYEFAMPVAEVNAVAKELDIKVMYELKILTGEEQLPDQTSSAVMEPSFYDGLSSSSQEEQQASDTGERPREKKKDTKQYGPDLVTHLERIDQLDMPPALYIKAHLVDYEFDFYWSKENFMARRYKILELYGAWDMGGKAGLVESLIEQSRLEGDYLFDPFIDDPNVTLTLIGYAQITLKPLSFMADLSQSFDLVDYNDEIIGSINIQATPCNPLKSSSDGPLPFEPLSGDELNASFLEKPEDLLGRKLVFVIKILSCQDIPHKYSNVFCQYNLGSGQSTIRTKMMRDGSLETESFSDQSGDSSGQKELVFNHSHYICFEKVDQDILDFLEHGFLTIQLVGHYKVPDKMVGRSPTLVSTIINNINKYRYKMEQQGSSYRNLNYPTSAFHSSNNTDSAKSLRTNTSSAGNVNSNSYSSSVVSGSTTVNLFDAPNDEDERLSSINGLNQENIIDMILTKRKLDRAESQLVSIHSEQTY